MEFRWKSALLWSLVGMVFLTIAATWSRIDVVDRDLSQRVTQSLAGDGQDWASVSVDGRDITVEGRAFSDADRERAVDLAESVRGVRVVSDRSGLVAEQSPFTLELAREGGSIKAIGFVPGEAAASALREELGKAFPDAEIALDVSPARGAPEIYSGLVDHSVKLLAGFSRGKVRISNEQISIVGTAVDSRSHDRLTQLTGADLPRGAMLGELAIAPPVVSPYRWSLERDGDRVRMDGVVPSAAKVSSLRERLTGLDAVASVEGTLNVAQGAPERFDELAALAIEGLPDLSTGAAILVDSNLKLEGVASSGAAYERLTVDLPKRGAGLSVDVSAILPPEISPWRWSVSRDMAALTLSGHVPDAASRNELIAAARAVQGVESVADEMKIARGAPTGFLDAATRSIAQLEHFGVGAISMRDQSLDVRGTAAGTDAFSAASTFDGLPEGFEVGESNITPARVDAYEWKASKADRDLSLTGFLPSSGLRKNVRDRIAGLGQGWKVTDNSQIALGAGEGFEDRALSAIDLLPHLAEGSVAVSGGAIMVEGTAASPESYEQLVTDANGGNGINIDGVLPATVAPYQWSADRQGDAVVLEGYAPDIATREALVTAYSTAMPSAAIDNRIKVAAGAPEAFAEDVAALAGILTQLPQGRISFDGTRFSVAGRAESDGALAKIQSQLANMGADVDAEGLLPPPPPEEYPLVARVTGRTVVLEGLAPDRDARRAVAAAISEARPQLDVVNRLVPRSGAPDYFSVLPNLMRDLLASLETGTVRAVDGEIEVLGTATTALAHRSLLERQSQAPDHGLSWGRFELQPPVVSPYSWRITEDDGRTVLSGFTPDADIASRLAERADAAARKEVEISNQQLQASGAPTNFEEAAGVMIDALSELERGEASLTGNRVVLEGRAISEQAAQQLSEAFRDSLPDGFRAAPRLSWPVEAAEPVELVTREQPAVDDGSGSENSEGETRAPAPTVQSVEEAEAAGCRLDFVALFEGQQVQFTSNRAVVRETSLPLLTRIAEAVKACPEQARFRIEGHTDSRGGEDFNMQLSEARARSVMDRLSELGVPTGKMTARGFGETLPAAENETAEGRAKNRRIEVRVVREAQ